MAAPLYPHRPYLGSADLPALLHILRTRPPERVTAYPSLVDLQEIAATPEGQESLQVWEGEGGGVLAFALLQEGSLAFDVAAGAPFDMLGEAILAWAAENSAGCEALETSCRDSDTMRVAFLERRGFVAGPVRTLHMQRSLRKPIPEPQLPAGFTLRASLGADEAEAWVALHRAAHGTENMTVAYRLAMMATPEYRPELDLVAVAPDDRLAAYCVCYFSREEQRLRGLKVGYTDPVATHPDFQGRGLARALLLAGFRALQACGIETAELGTWGENTTMIRAAEAAGYRTYSSTIFFARPLEGRTGILNPAT